MNKLMSGLLVAGTAAFLAGCEWSGGGDGWNSRWDFVNFSGSYRGSPLVSAYSMTSGGTPSSDGYQVVRDESGGTTGNNKVQFSGKTQFYPVKPGSFTIVIGGVSGSAVDNGAGELSGYFVLGVTNLTASGTIKYDTGTWTLQLSPPGFSTPNLPILLNYSYAVTGGGGGSGIPGGTKVTILAFNVQQSGNQLTIIDNNGSVYNGSFGSVTSTGGGGSGGAFANGDEIVGQYSASGTSAAGIKVNMVGTFQAVVSGASSTASGSQTMVLSSRTMLGTWIEDGGVTGDINGSAASVTVTANVSTNAP